MANEILKRDANNEPVAGFVTDDASQEIRMGRIDDATKGMKVMIVGGVGAGTVTIVSVATANGISGTVATATTTPAITLSLGAITPSSVNSVVLSGSSTPTLAVTGTSTISGSNTGDQTTVSGNAGTATALQNARTIGGVSFNGTANITVASATGGFTVSGGDLAIGANNITVTGSLAATGSRVTKGWFTDVESTNMPTVGGTSLTTVSQTFQNKTISNSNNILGGVTMTLGSDADGDTYYRASNVLTRLPKGTALQQLRMNAGATAPEWATVSSSFDPTTTMVLYDDFISNPTPGELNWVLSSIAGGSTWAAQLANNNNCGQWSNTSAGTSGDAGIIYLSSAFSPTTINGNTWTMIVRLILSTTTNQIVRMGITNDISTLAPAQNICIELDTAANANWRGNNRSGSADSYTSTTVAPTTNYVQLKMVCTAGTVEFFVDGVTLGTKTGLNNTLNFPYILSGTRTNATKAVSFDYFYMIMTGLTR